MLDKITAAVSRHHMFKKGDCVAVALSGGADSAALLHTLFALGFDPRAIHVNHMIRGDEAARDAAFVGRLCESMGVRLDHFTADVPALAAERGVGLEEAGRICRYRIFDTFSSQHDCKIATAHTLSDSAETMIFHLARGCGLSGLRGIPAVRGNVVRPLIDVTRAEVEAYCAENGIEFVTDSTNADARYSRNLIRAEIIPKLMEINPLFPDAARRLSALAAEEDDYLDSLADAAVSAASRGNGCYEAAALAALAGPVLLRAVRIIAGRETGVVPELRRAGEMREMIRAGSGAVSLHGDFTARNDNGKIIIKKQTRGKTGKSWEIPLEFPVSTRPDGRIISFEIIDISEFRARAEESGNVNNLLLNASLDYDKIALNTFLGSAVFRGRRDGDRFLPRGGGRGRKLKKLMNEAKIPAEHRDRLALLDMNGIIFAEGFGAAEGWQVSDGTRRVLVLHFAGQIIEYQEGYHGRA